ncbi:MAG: hypothetical protein J1F18_07290 [Lachnospiraceae bacterium]|nr:hypothetical protein [Lachnospiraceae bacterium]
MSDIIEIIMEVVTNERLDDIARQDEIFCAIDARLNEALNSMDSLSISKQDLKEISKVLDIFAEYSARYAHLAYRQGLRDFIQLLKFIGII